MWQLKLANPIRLTELWVELLFLFCVFVLLYAKSDYSKLYKDLDLKANLRLMYKFGPEGFWDTICLLVKTWQVISLELTEVGFVVL